MSTWFQNKQINKQINKQHLKDVQILKSQIDSSFDGFDAFLKLLKSNNVDQTNLIVWNDQIVAMLSLLGAECIEKQKHTDTLTAAYNYFTQKKKKLKNSDKKLIKEWLKYVNVALTSPTKLPKLQITANTINRGQKNFNSKYANNFVGNVLSAGHNTQNMLKDVEENPEKYHRQHLMDVESAQLMYNTEQQNPQVVTQNGMYGPCGGGKNLQFAYVSSNKDDSKQNDIFIDNQMNNLQISNQISNTNAVVLRGALIIQRDNKPVFMHYPMPCLILQELDNVYAGVQLAWPYNDVNIRYPKQDLLRNKLKVSEEEQKYLIQLKQNSLGYKSIKEMDSGIVFQ